MDDLDITLKIIPVNELKKVLFDESAFLDFYRQNNKDYIDNKNSYLKGLNDLMIFLIQNDDSLTEEIFHRINSINNHFNIELFYDYSKYQYKTEKLINFKILESILLNEEVYNKFLDYTNNLDFFGNIPLMDYLVSLNNYYSSINENHLNFPNYVNERFKGIMKRYPLEYKTSHVLSGTFIEATIPKHIENEILSNVNLNNDKFTIAWNLYIELNKRCSFNSTFVALNQSMENPISKKIYETNVSNVKNHKYIVICRTWAIAYANLLKKCGINASVVGKFHKYVQFDADGTLMEADATSIIRDDKLGLNDITRCQLNMKTLGFRCVEQNKDISLIMENADNKLNYNTKTQKDYERDLFSQYTDKLIQSRSLISVYASKFMSKRKRIETYDKLKFLSNVARKSKLDNFELMHYVTLIYDCMFSEYAKTQISHKFICFKNMNNSYTAGLVFSINLGDYFDFVLFDKAKGMRSIDSATLSQCIQNGKIVIASKNKEIQGLMEDKNYGNIK